GQGQHARVVRRGEVRKARQGGAADGEGEAHLAVGPFKRREQGDPPKRESREGGLKPAVAAWHGGSGGLPRGGRPYARRRPAVAWGAAARAGRGPGAGRGAGASLDARGETTAQSPRFTTQRPPASHEPWLTTQTPPSHSPALTPQSPPLQCRRFAPQTPPWHVSVLAPQMPPWQALVLAPQRPLSQTSVLTPQSPPLHVTVLTPHAPPVSHEAAFTPHTLRPSHVAMFTPQIAPDSHVCVLAPQMPSDSHVPAFAPQAPSVSQRPTLTPQIASDSHVAAFAPQMLPPSQVAALMPHVAWSHVSPPRSALTRQAPAHHPSLYAQSPGCGHAARLTATHDEPQKPVFTRQSPCGSQSPVLTSQSPWHVPALTLQKRGGSATLAQRVAAPTPISAHVAGAAEARPTAAPARARRRSSVEEVVAMGAAPARGVVIKTVEKNGERKKGPGSRAGLGRDYSSFSSSLGLMSPRRETSSGPVGVSPAGASAAGMGGGLTAARASMTFCWARCARSLMPGFAKGLGFICRVTAPVPRLTGWPTMMFSATPSRGSISPTMPASRRWFTVISNAARARTEDFSPEMPWRPMARMLPSDVMTSLTSMRWRMSTMRPCSLSVL